LGRPFSVVHHYGDIGAPMAVVQAYITRGNGCFKDPNKGIFKNDVMSRLVLNLDDRDLISREPA
jgi:hypothetical protein